MFAKIKTVGSFAINDSSIHIPPNVFRQGLSKQTPYFADLDLFLQHIKHISIQIGVVATD